MLSEVMGLIRAQADETPEKRLELKVCERCGGLWLRPAGSRWIYCGPCKAKVDDLPAVVEKRYAKRPRLKGAGKERVR